MLQRLAVAAIVRAVLDDGSVDDHLTTKRLGYRYALGGRAPYVVGDRLLHARHGESGATQMTGAMTALAERNDKTVPIHLT